MDYEQINRKTGYGVRILKGMIKIETIPNGQRVFFEDGNCKIREGYYLREIIVSNGG